MTYRIGKAFKFDAAHQLDGLPADHQCSRLHGHTYAVEIELTAETVDDVGFVLDYGELAPLKTWIDDTLDHRYLNDVLAINPTAENLAAYIYDRFSPTFPLMSAVVVRETASTFSEYRR